MKRVVGLDLSLTSTGICSVDGNPSTVAGDAKMGDRRLTKIAGAIAIMSTGAELAVIEDLPRGAMGGSTTGMAQGVARLTLMQLNIPYALVPPATLKMYATGKGTASKIEMAISAYKRAEWEFPNDDECDAWWLRAMGLDFLGEPLFELPAAQRKALAKVAWPVTS